MPALMDTPATPALVVDLLLRIPYAYRRFSVTAENARRTYGIDRELCRELAARGLPHLGEDPDALFDENDLATASLHLGLKSVRRFTMGFWLDSLARLRHGATRYEVTVSATCPTPAHRGPCRYEVLAADGGRRTVTAERRTAAQVGRLAAEAAEAPYPVPSPLRGLVADFSDVDFCPLPFTLADDVDFLRTARIGTCPLLAAALVEAAWGRGFEARTSYGLVVAAPYSQAHTWAEIRVAGRWVKVDPLMPRILRRTGLCDEEGWPPTLSPAGLYHRLGASGPLVSHAWAECGVSLATAVVP
ncbi:transglutaminase domain-containing protein [Streptomyces sp. ME19-01-6]|uniref:transglutaminase domain-containing protein n=1 Tax=Streptomyces sp. ME19-01-6 TaxID=3028686 RepID=UPI0029C9F9E8|nr:transglutaminase domain-containing protein [Streptomyces sp. ME19-01-6]